MINQTIQGRYKLESELGRGGMGTVFRAYDSVLARHVAIKVLSNASLGEEGRARMLHEARASAGLNHPNIVAVFDAGETAESGGQGTSPFIVMEIVEGGSLFERMPVSQEEIVPLAIQICQALQHAHGHGVIHRDLKPENILISPDDTAKLMDFGLARSVTSRLSSQGQIVGTVLYLAPELALGQPFDGRADLYALGVLLYELAVGQLPFEAEDPLAVVSQHIHAPVVPPRALSPDLAPALDDLILRLLEKDPANRPSDSAEVIQLLSAIQQGSEADISEGSSSELSVLDRIVRGRFIGRTRDLADAKALWRRAEQGSGSVLLISGEPGIGKTRFIRELKTLAEVSGGQTFTGVSFPEGGAPYAPISQIISAELQKLEAVRWPEHILSDLLTLTPSLIPAYPDVQPNPPLDPQAEQHRLYENVFLFMVELSSKSPLMLIFEDVHWADSGSLAMIRHLARRTKEQRILVVASYREVEIDQARPLNRFLLDLNRERLAHRIKLARLEKIETAALLKAILAEEITPEFLDAIYRETEGNPFFIEEVCKALIESGRLYFEAGRWQRPAIAELEIPQSIRISIQSRLTLLSQLVYDVLLLAAALGRSFEYETLWRASGQTEAVVIEALEAAERAQLIEEIGSTGGGTFTFSHALIPATMLEGASGLRRRRLHRQILEVLTVQKPDDLDTLTHHAFQSGDQRKGMEFAIRAGDQALRIHALEEAAGDFERALEAAETLGLADKLSFVNQRLGEVFALQGNLPEAIEYLNAALEQTLDLGERAVVQAKIGEVHTLAGDALGQQILLDALEHLDPDHHAAVRAMALANLGRTYHLQGHHRKAARYLEEALVVGRALDEPALLTTAYGYLAGAYQHLAEVESSLAMAERLVEIGDRLKYPYATAMGFEFMAEDYVIVGDWDQGMKYALLNRDLGEKLGALDRVAWADFSIGLAQFGLGNLAEARDAAQRSLDVANELGHPRLAVIVGSQLAATYLELDQMEAAEAAARAAYNLAERLRLSFPLQNALNAVGLVQIASGDYSEALRSYQRAAAILKDTDSPFNPWTSYVGVGRALHGLGEIEQARQTLEKFVNVAAEIKLDYSKAIGQRFLGQIVADDADRQNAVEILMDATATFKRLNCRLDLATCLYQLGALEMKRGQSEQGSRYLQEARGLAEAMGAMALLKKIEHEESTGSA